MVKAYRNLNLYELNKSNLTIVSEYKENEQLRNDKFNELNLMNFMYYGTTQNE